MTPLAKRQLCQALHRRYRVASRSEKAQLLTAFIKATDYHRKYAIQLLAHGPSSTPRRGPTWVRYDDPIVTALRRVWEASGYLCSKRLHAFLAPFLEALERAGEVCFSRPVKAALLAMSAATIDRKLAPHRRRLIGYDRYEGHDAAHAFNQVYEVLRLWINFFQPSLKLHSKQRRGAKIIKRYDPAKTPYQRVLEAADISRRDKDALRGLYQTLNPVWIRRELERRIEVLWTLAVRSEIR